MHKFYTKQWEFLKNKFENDQLSHAYLFSGGEGIGKKTFAKEFVKFINCKESKDGVPCEKCFSCLSIEKGSFPDFKIIKKDPEKSEIEISQVRAVQNFLNYKSYYGSYKAVLVDGAENMNTEAQNCFLKTLEEPRGDTMLFLVTSKPDMLLPTIFSRCQTVKFFKPKGLPENTEKAEREEVILKEILPLLDGGLAEKFKYVKSADADEKNFAEIARIIQKYLRHLLMVKIGTEKQETRDLPFIKYTEERLKKAIILAEEINNKLVFTNANQKLALEILLMEI